MRRSPLVGAALVGPLLTLRAVFPAWEAWIWIAVVVVAVGAVTLQISKVVADHRRDAAAASFRVQLRDALLPVSGVVADMEIDARPRVRQEQIRTAAQATTGALCQLIQHAPRVRANVFWIDESDDLSWLAHSGRGERPGAFMRGTPRGDAAFEFLATLRPAFYPDLMTARPAGYEGSMSGYRTFIAVPIWASGRSFGMITVDSPNANGLVIEDQYVLEMFAEVMSIAFVRGLHGSTVTSTVTLAS